MATERVNRVYNSNEILHRSFQPTRYPFNSIEIKPDLNTGEPRVFFQDPPDAEDLRLELDKRFNCYVKGREAQGMYYEVLRVLHPDRKMAFVKETRGGEEQLDVGQMLRDVDTRAVVESLREMRFSKYKPFKRVGGKDWKNSPHNTVSVNERILDFLLDQKGRMVTAEELIVAAWGKLNKDLIPTYYNSLFNSVSRLRDALVGEDFALAASRRFYTRYFAILPTEPLNDVAGGETLRIGYPGFENFVEGLPTDPVIKESATKLASFEVKTDTGGGNSVSLMPRISRKQVAYLIAFLISDGLEVSVDELRIVTTSKSCEFKNRDWRPKTCHRLSVLRAKIRELDLPIEIVTTFRNEERRSECYQLRVKD